MKKIVLSVFTFLCITATYGQTLITDINQTGNGASSEASLLEPGFVELNGNIYTMASDGSDFSFYKYENNNFIKLPNTSTVSWYTYKKINNKIYYTTVEQKDGVTTRPIYEFDGTTLNRIYVAPDSAALITGFFGKAGNGVWIRDGRNRGTMYYYQNGTVLNKWASTTAIGSVGDTTYYTTLTNRATFFKSTGTDSIPIRSLNSFKQRPRTIGLIGDTLFYTTSVSGSGTTLWKWNNELSYAVGTHTGNISFFIRRNHLIGSEYFTSNRKRTFASYIAGELITLLDTADFPTSIRMDSYGPIFTSDDSKVFFTTVGTSADGSNIHSIDLATQTIKTLYTGDVSKELELTAKDEIIFQSHDRTKGLAAVYITDGNGSKLLTDTSQGRWARFYNAAAIGDTLFYNTFLIDKNPTIGYEPHKLALTPKAITNRVSTKTAEIIKVYPNPASSTISLQTTKTPSHIKVYNITGQKQSVGIQGKIILLDMLPVGVFYLQAVLDDTMHTAKFIKN